MTTTTNPKAIEALLATFAGKPVSVENLAHEQSDYAFVQIYVHGKLELPDPDEEEAGLYYVRVAEGYDGASGIGFPLRKIREVNQHPGSGRLTILLA